MGKFNGIDTFHDGLAVSDYVNMVPLGDSCIDRLGEQVISSLAFTSAAKVRGHFVDSAKRIYIVLADMVHVFEPSDESYTYAGIMAGLIDGEPVESFRLIGKTGPVSFAESSIKPSTVYLCDGFCIYKWDSTGSQALMIRTMLPPNVFPVLPEEWEAARAIDPYDILTGRSGKMFDTSEMARIDSIDWFDNKLVGVQKDKNTVWLTCTDPEQFDRDASLNPWGEQYQLWNNWYASTNSADKLNTAVAFGGQLYLLNDNSIEIWARTGMENAPLQSNTMQVIHHGARNPLVIGDFMYVIANDRVGSDYVALIQNGQFKRISSFEIDHRLREPIDIVPIAMRGETYIMVRDNGGLDGYVYTEGKWWHWVHPQKDTDGVISSVYKNFAITDRGVLVKFTDDSRRTYTGEPIVRYIRDSFETWHTRKLFRRISVSMDSGRVTEPGADDDLNRQIYIRLSTNRGLSFGQYFFRKLGKSGMNNKVVEWLGLGSGNSMLLEVGTSSAYKLQIYDINIVVQ